MVASTHCPHCALNCGLGLRQEAGAVVGIDRWKGSPLTLTTGRVLHHYLSGAQTRRMPAQLAVSPEPVMELHPETATACGLVDPHEHDHQDRIPTTSKGVA